VPSKPRMRIALLNTSPRATAEASVAQGDLVIIRLAPGTPLLDLNGFEPDVIIIGDRAARWFAAAASTSRSVPQAPPRTGTPAPDHSHDQPRRETRHPLRRLTLTQQRVLLMLHAGLTNSEIPRELQVAVRTVKGYLAQLFTMFDVTNRTELLGSAFDLGVIGAILEGKVPTTVTATSRASKDTSPPSAQIAPPGAPPPNLGDGWQSHAFRSVLPRET